jgi:hypothetical protein
MKCSDRIHVVASLPRMGGPSNDQPRSIFDSDRSACHSCNFSLRLVPHFTCMARRRTCTSSRQLFGYHGKIAQSPTGVLWLSDLLLALCCLCCYIALLPASFLRYDMIVHYAGGCSWILLRAPAYLSTVSFTRTQTPGPLITNFSFCLSHSLSLLNACRSHGVYTVTAHDGSGEESCTGYFVQISINGVIANDNNHQPSHNSVHLCDITVRSIRAAV